MKHNVITLIWGLSIFLNFLSASINYELDSSSSLIFNICMAIFCTYGLLLHLHVGGQYEALNERITNKIFGPIRHYGSEKEKEKKDQENS
jgi:hypothetical protein